MQREADIHPLLTTGKLEKASGSYKSIFILFFIINIRLPLLLALLVSRRRSIPLELGSDEEDEGFL